MRKCQQSPEQAKTAQLTYWRRADAEAKLMDQGTMRMTRTCSQMCRAVAEIRKWLKTQVEKSECIRGQETKTRLVSSKAKLRSVPGDGVTLVSMGIMDMHHKNELIDPLGMRNQWFTFGQVGEALGRVEGVVASAEVENAGSRDGE